MTFDIVTIWQFDWQFDILTIWHFDNLTFWQFDILTFWQFDILTIWHSKTLVIWKNELALSDWLNNMDLRDASTKNDIWSKEALARFAVCEWKVHGLIKVMSCIANRRPDNEKPKQWAKKYHLRWEHMGTSRNI